MIKEVTTLPDMQRSEDPRGIGLWKVGVKEVEIPLRVAQRDGGEQMVHAVTSMGVSCSELKKGVNMSRFVVHLSEWSAKGPFGSDLSHFLEDMRDRLEAEDAHCDLTFRYFLQKAAPVTGLTAPMAITATFRGSLEKTPEGDVYNLRVGLEVPIANCCPCSKAISEYGAHNQRSYIRAECTVDTAEGAPKVWIEDLVDHLEEAASCPVYPLLKRPDEKYVTERQYDNPKFVEDVIRDATLELRKVKGIKGFALEVEALESIHGHNAWAAHRENVDCSSMF
jgi:GTP cyclohydrolase I